MNLTILALLVIGVTKDTTVQQSSVNISHHGSDISRRVWLSVGRVFNALEVRDDGWVKVHRVSLVERVDLSSGWNFDVRVGKDKLSERLVERETVDTLSSGQDQVAGRSVHCVSGSDHFGTRSKGILDCSF